MFNLNAKFDADSLLYSVMPNAVATEYTWLTQWCLPPPLTSTVKASLFMHEHSSLLSLAARLYGCHTNCSFYINNSWTFSGQTSCAYRMNCFKVEIIQKGEQNSTIKKHCATINKQTNSNNKRNKNF